MTSQAAPCRHLNTVAVTELPESVDGCQDCLREGGVQPEDLSYVAFYEKPLAKFERLLETYLAYAPRGLRSFSLAMPQWLRGKLNMRRTLRRGLGGRSATPILFLDHHHAVGPGVLPSLRRYRPAPGGGYTVKPHKG